MQIKMFLLTICFIIILFFTIYYLYLLYQEKNNSGCILLDSDRQIKQNNKILFYKLKKQYLNNVSDEDILDLISFLCKEIDLRGCKNESKK